MTHLKKNSQQQYDYLRMKQPPNAPKTRRLRQAGDGSGSHKRGSVCHMHGESISEAKAKAPQVKPLGSWLKVKAPALQAQRDMLFEQYLRAYDNYNNWINEQVDIYCTNRGKDDHLKRRELYLILKRHCQELSEQLIRYDERINAAQTTGPLLY